MKRLWHDPGHMQGEVMGKIHRIEAEASRFKDEIKLRSWNRIYLPGGWWL